MADDTILLPGGGGDRLRTEEIGIKKYPVSKIVLGAAGVDDGDVSAANPMPITGTITVNVGLTDSELRASAVPVTGPLTDAQLRALAVPVSGTFFQATQPVSGPLTDAQLRAVPVPVSGTITATVTGIATEAKQDAQSTLIGAVNETPPVTDTGNSGLNGMLKRISQRITFLISLFPISIGTKNAAGSLSVTPSSDGEFKLAASTNAIGSVMVSHTMAEGGFWLQGNGNTTLGQERGVIFTWVEGSDTRFTSDTKPLPVDIKNASIAVTGTFFQVTQPVSGPLTDAELRATAVPVSLSTVAVTNAGTFLVQAAQSGTWTVQIGNTPNSTPILVSDRPATSGGLTPYSFLSTASVQTAAVKASAGQVYGLSFFNKGAAAVYLKLYNMTTAPGTGDTVIWRAIIPGNTAGAGLVKHFPNGLEFSTGIGFRCTGAIADNDATALAANEVTGNIEYN